MRVVLQNHIPHFLFINQNSPTEKNALKVCALMMKFHGKPIENESHDISDSIPEQTNIPLNCRPRLKSAKKAVRAKLVRGMA